MCVCVCISGTGVEIKGNAGCIPGEPTSHGVRTRGPAPVNVFMLSSAFASGDEQKYPLWGITGITTGALFLLCFTRGC